MKPFKLVKICFFVFFSCGEEAHKHKSLEDLKRTDFLEKIDSVRIDFLGNSVVHDVDPNSKIVVFVESGDGGYSEKIYLADFSGSIINSFSKFGDVPDSYGILLSTIRLLDSERFLVYGFNGFIIYDFEGKMLSRVKIPEMQPSNYNPVWMGQGMEKLNDGYVYVNQDFPKNGDYSTKDLYATMNLMKTLDPATGKRKSIIQFPETSIFRNGNHFFRNAWDPVFHVAAGKIYISFGLEPVIYVFNDSPPYSLFSTIPMDFPDYRYFKGAASYSSDWRFFGLRFTSGMILNIKKIGDYFLVAYFPGYDASDTETNFENKTPEESKVFRERMQQKYPDRIALVDSLGNVINDFVPEGLEPSSMLLRDGKLWMMEKRDEEVERDYFRLFRVGLKVD